MFSGDDDDNDGQDADGDNDGDDNIGFVDTNVLQAYMFLYCRPIFFIGLLSQEHLVFGLIYMQPSLILSDNF